MLQGALCGACRSILAPGARFCHRCGASVGSAVAPAGRGNTAAAVAGVTPGSASRPTNYLPWALAGLAGVALIVILAAQRSSPSAGTAEVTPAGPFAGAPGPAAASDISNMSPRERLDRLYDRIMRLDTEGKKDSVAFFASMVSSVYESLGPLDPDLRYDYGRISEVSGNLDVAGAQADSILIQAPNHLLGLILATHVAEARKDTKRRQVLDQKLLAVQESELKKSLPEYTRHRSDIDAALAAARARNR